MVILHTQKMKMKLLSTGCKLNTSGSCLDSVWESPGLNLKHPKWVSKKSWSECMFDMFNYSSPFPPPRPPLSQKAVMCILI